MKLFNWVHNKLNGRQSTISDTNISASTKNQAQHFRDQKEEFSDWPQGFLSIGTLFTKQSKEHPKDQHNAILDLTMEEVKELQTLVSSNNDINGLSNSDGSDDKDQRNNIDHLSSFNNGEEEEEEEEEISDKDCRAIVTNNCSKEVYMDNNGSKAVMGKKTLSFLLKKMFICGSLAPTPSLRDPIHSATPKIKVSKLLRAMLRKKIYPQNSCSNMTTCKKYLGMSGRIGSSNYDDDDEDEFDNGGNRSTKWDKTDTDYIVLEI